MARPNLPTCGSIVVAMLAASAMASAADCFVDSVGGSDANNGQSEASAWQSLSKIASSCTTAKFKRGSVFNIAAGSGKYAINLMGTQLKTLTNYGDASQPLPKFVKPHQASSGAVFSSFSQITIDGLHISGSRSDAAMSNLADGICIMIGGGSASQPSEIKNCEVTLCDIGMMTSGDYVQVHDNYIHDLSISVDAAPGVDPNAVGGAEGIFVNSSHVRVHHNRFVNCTTAAQWVSNTNGGGVRCDGGATEVTVKYAGVVTDVEIDHNFSFNSCGFFEIASMFNTGSGTYVKGQFTNSVFHDNVIVDSGWISLLQVNNTKLSNVRWENNTIVHHDVGTTKDANGNTINLNDFGSSSIQAIAFNGTSSGATGGGEISAGDIYWTNNLWYFDAKVAPYNLIDPAHRGSDALLANITVTGDTVVTADPGFKDITSKSDPNAYDLVKGSIAIDKGVTDTSVSTYVKTDYSNRPRPSGAGFDLGAFEYQGDNAGGSSGTGGSSALATGGKSTNTSGGSAAATGGVATTAAGGALALGTGGANSALGGASTGTSLPNAVGGAFAGTGGESNGSLAGSSGYTTGAIAATEVGNCSCKLASHSRSASSTGVVGLAAVALSITRIRRRYSSKLS